MAGQVAVLTTRVQAGNNVALIGPPGMGKSWTLRQVGARLGSAGVENFFADLQSCDSAAEALRKILNSTGSKSQSTDSDRLWKELGQRTWERNPTVLLLDEFDAVRRFPDGAEFLRNLREKVQFASGSRGPTIVVAIRRPLRMIEESVSGISTLDSVFTPTHCSFMNAADLHAAWPSVFPEVVDFDSAIRWTFGVPEICSRLFNRNHALAHPVFEDYDRVEWSQNAVTYFESIGLGDAVQQYLLGPVMGRRPMDAARLISMSAIPSSWRQTDTRVAPLGSDFGPLWDFPPFVEEVRHRSKGLDAWGTRGRAEIAGRQLVSKLLETEDWTAGHHPVFGLLNAANRRARTAGVLDPSLGDAVAHLEEGELWAAVSRCGSATLSRLSPPDPDVWKPRLEPLGGIGRMRGMERSRDDIRFTAVADSISIQIDLLDRASRPGCEGEQDERSLGDDAAARVIQVRWWNRRGWRICGGVLAGVSTIAAVLQVVLQIVA